MPSCRKVDGRGPVVSETRNISGFSEIKSDFTGDVYVTQGSISNIRIEAQQNIIDVLETVLNDGILTIRVKSNTVVRPDSRIRVYVTAPNITGLRVSGSGSMMVQETLNTSNLYVRVNGSGDVNITKLTTGSLDANISGSGEINVFNGTADEEYIDIAGSGSADCSGLAAYRSDVKISGSGDARVYALDQLKVRITGSGNVYYRGQPSIDVGITGSGKLRPM
ncbi:head GIN domain-containing protein [Taibaiella koreensis]|uniref:head GIN domain-containing protein n=1 Tax=Taibaiella koreensis TaxID=1268548 RepID=UPI0013C335A8|nr:head GIN domain-containing protein [Taibaiella koreensis]